MTIETEYRAAKSSNALLVHQHMVGYLTLSGNDHVDLLHRITTNELRNLISGQGQVNVFANEVGRIVDRVHLLKKERSIVLLPSPGKLETLSDWIDKFVFIEDVKVEKHSSAMLAVFGPEAPELLRKSFKESNVPDNCGFQEISFEGRILTVINTPELSWPGFNLLTPPELMNSVRNLMADAYKDEISVITEETYEILRIEAGWPVSGRDFDEKVNPHEAGMQPYINFDKGCYVGQEVIARLDTYEKVQKKLTGIAIDGALPEPGDPVEVAGKNCGEITSAALSPDFGYIALAYIRNKFLDSKEIIIKTKNKELKGRLCPLPFEERT